jgi:precorrin isomerase
MANAITVQPLSAAQFIIDSNSVAAPIKILANRSFGVIDFAIAVTAVSGAGDGGNESRLRIDEVDANNNVITALGTIPTTLAGLVTLNTFRRPSTTAIVAAPANASDALIANASVARGNYLRIIAASTGAADATLVRALGTLRILAGNRYAAGKGTYYPNNATSGAQGSNAVQSI